MQWNEIKQALTTRRGHIHHAVLNGSHGSGRTLHQPAASCPADRHVQTAENRAEDKSAQAGRVRGKETAPTSIQGPNKSSKPCVRAKVHVLPDHVPPPQQVRGSAYGWISSANLPIPWTLTAKPAHAKGVKTRFSAANARLADKRF